MPLSEHLPAIGNHKADKITTDVKPPVQIVKNQRTHNRIHVDINGSSKSQEYKRNEYMVLESTLF